MHKTGCLLSAALLIALFWADTLHAQAKISNSADSLIIERAFFGLSVADVDAMASWYCDNLGFHIDKKGDGSGGAPRFAILSRPGALIEMMEFASAKSRAGWGLSTVEVHEIHGIFKLGFDITNLNEMFVRAKEKKLKIFFPIVQPRDVPRRTFGLNDPEGNIIQFFGK